MGLDNELEQWSFFNHLSKAVSLRGLLIGNSASAVVAMGGIVGRIRGFIFHSTRGARESCCETLDTACVSHTIINWVSAQDDLQAVAASLVVLFAVWWMLRSLLSVILNVLIPMFVILFVVICVPHLREPLLGGHYPTVSNFLQSVLLRLVDLLKNT